MRGLLRVALGLGGPGVSGGEAPWYLAEGVEPSACVGAYQGIGAASYEASLVNLVNPGTNDLTPISNLGATYPPQWTRELGWQFPEFGGEVVSAFDTGIVPDTTGQTWSMIIWYAGAYASPPTERIIAGKPSESGGRFYLSPAGSPSSPRVWYVHGNSLTVAPAHVTGSVAIAGNKAYRDGVAESGTIPAANAVSTKSIRIGNMDGYLLVSFSGEVRLAAIYNVTLTPEQVAAIVAAGDAVIAAAPTWTEITSDAALPDRPATPTFILDSDLGSDCDDAGGIAVIHKMMDDGLVDMIAIVNERTNIYPVAATDAINYYYGRNIPIGANKGDAFMINDTYAQHLAENFATNGATYATAPDAIDLYRQTLAAQATPIRILAVGPLRLLHQLLLSEADGHSALTGAELVAAKVSEIVIVAGIFPDSPWAEYNLRMDAAASAYVFANCPVPITIVGCEVGDAAICGAGLTANTPETNPVRKAYELHVTPNKGRPAWDTFATLYLAYGLEHDGTQYFSAIRGTAAVDAETGMNTFVPSATGEHVFLRRKIALPTSVALLNAYMEAAPA